MTRGPAAENVSKSVSWKLSTSLDGVYCEMFWQIYRGPQQSSLPQQAKCTSTPRVVEHVKNPPIDVTHLCCICSVESQLCQPRHSRPVFLRKANHVPATARSPGSWRHPSHPTARHSPGVHHPHQLVELFLRHLANNLAHLGDEQHYQRIVGTNSMVFWIESKKLYLVQCPVRITRILGTQRV